MPEIGKDKERCPHMTLADERLKELDNPSLTTDERVLFLDHQDGSVLVRHGGVEMGQGLLTKVAQIAARELNLPMTFIETSALDTQVVPNPISTGASTGTAFNGAHGSTTRFPVSRLRVEGRRGAV